MAPGAWKRESFILPCILVATAAAIYFNTFTNEFVSDDLSAIRDNPWIREARYIPQFFVRSLWSFLPTEVYSNYFRPFELLFFSFGYMISAQSTWGYHLLNIILHASSGVLVFLIARLLIGVRGEAGAGERKRASLAFFAALLFVTNPVNTEAVAWAAAVSELSFAFFLLLGLYLYMRGRPWISALFFIFSVFSKETGLVLPILLVIYDLVIGREPLADMRGWVKRYLPYIVCVLVYVALRYNAIGGVVPFESDEKLLTDFQYLLNLVPLTVEFIVTMVVPAKLVFFNYVRLDHILSFWEVRNFFFLIFLIVFIYILKRLRNREPALFFTLLWIVVPLLPIFYLGWNQGEPTFAERFAYLPSAGLSISVVLISSMIIDASTKKGRDKNLLTLVGALMIVVSIIFSVATVGRNRVWRNSLTLWQDTVQKAPHNVVARLSYANQLTRDRRFEEASGEYAVVLREMPENAEARNGLGVVYAEMGLIDAAIVEFQRAVRARPDFDKAQRNLERALKFRSNR